MGFFRRRYKDDTGIRLNNIEIIQRRILEKLKLTAVEKRVHCRRHSYTTIELLTEKEIFEDSKQEAEDKARSKINRVINLED